jgi:hypothetical protein
MGHASTARTAPFSGDASKPLAPYPVDEQDMRYRSLSDPDEYQPGSSRTWPD